MRKSGYLYPLLVLAAWTILVVAGTGAMVIATWRQHLAESFPTTEGKIIKSEVGMGVIIRRGVEIEYNYMVAGKSYTGHVFRYDDHNISFEWQGTVELMPRWSARKVYYNPKNPADSVLNPGVDGGDLLQLLFALPINVFTFALWRAVMTRLRDKARLSQPAGGVQILKRPEEIRAVLAETSAIATGFVGMALAAFVAIFPVVIASGFDPRPQMMELAWAVVVAIGVAVYIWRAAKNWSGANDLRVDPNTKSVIVPRMPGHPKPLPIACKEISGVAVQRRVSTTPSGTYYSYLPALIRHGQAGSPQSIKLIDLGWSEEKASAFSQWLSKELGVDYKGVEDEILARTAKN